MIMNNFKKMDMKSEKSIVHKQILDIRFHQNYRVSLTQIQAVSFGIVTNNKTNSRNHDGNF